MQYKKCKCCGETKEFSEYHINKRQQFGLADQCKPCRKKLSHEKHKKNWFHQTVILKKSYCQSKGIPFDLDKEYLESIWTTHCPISGVEFIKHSKAHNNSPTLDRIVPSLGYTKGNVVYISARMNRIKYDASIKELRIIADWLEGATTRS